MNEYAFHERLAFSTAHREGRSYEQLIRDMLPGIVSVEKTNVTVDKTGIDYIARLRGGAPVNIDLKTRDKGCSSYWMWGVNKLPPSKVRQEEIALEIWSVKPENGRRGKVGWTLDEAKLTHYTLHVYDGSDSQRVFLLPFQLLRKAFRTNVRAWQNTYRIESQSSGGWHSECIFVPVSIVQDAIQIASEHDISEVNISGTDGNNVQH